nr:DUF3152 domain-containing protein [Streptomyces sp. CRN 30]
MGSRPVPGQGVAHETSPSHGGTPAYGTPRVRGGHPEQHEAGGGWGRHEGRAERAVGRTGTGAAAGAAAERGGRAGPRVPRQREQPAAVSDAYAGTGSRPAHPDTPPGGPRQVYLDAFDEVDDVFAPGQRHRVASAAARPGAGGGATGRAAGAAVAGGFGGGGGDVPAGALAGGEKGKGGKGRTFTGIAAAAVTTVLAVVVAGQVAGGGDGAAVQSQAAGGGERDSHDESASRSDERPTPPGEPSPVTLSYDQKMAQKYRLAAGLEGNGRFQAVAGFDEAPGAGQKYRYRVDVEEGLGLDAELFAKAVQQTLNDDRSWAHSGGRTFERISSGKPDFVITLASPGTTADWCAKSGLDTTIDNVSCDSAATDRVMINAYRWAQGAETYGDRIHAYRQMLINHEIGHRLGYNHVTCDKDGDLAPVMQQQTKFLDYGGVHCEANAWPFPNNS